MINQQPPRRPPFGLTFEPHDVFASGSSIIAKHGSREVEIECIDCHPLNRSNEPTPYTPHERAILDFCLRKESPVKVSLPVPAHSGGGAWIRSLVHDTLKAGWVWINDELTLSDVLVYYGHRSPVPPFPLETNGRAGIPTDQITVATHARPDKCPTQGLTLPVRQPVRCEDSIDAWRMQTHGGDEFVVWLIDCFTPKKNLAAAYEAAWSAMANSRNLAITIPRPLAASSDWIGSLEPNSEHPGWIWLDETTTLNQHLVALGFAKESMSS